MSDLIDREMALAFPLANDVYDHQRANKDFIAGCESYREWIARLPSAEPEKRTNKRTETHECDLISRQQAIDALRKMQTYKLFSGDDMLLIDQAGAMTELMLLPSAEPPTDVEQSIDDKVAELPSEAYYNKDWKSDMISRQAAINAIDECYCGGEDSCGEPWIYQENAVEAIQMIEPILPAEPQERTGEWIHDGSHWANRWICDKCGYKLFGVKTKFCPDCGQRMEADNDS